MMWIADLNSNKRKNAKTDANKIVSILFLIFFLGPGTSDAFERESLMIEIGLGLGRYDFNRPGDSSISIIGTPIKAAARADRELILQNQKQIPKQHRDFSKQLGSVSFTHPLIPKALYFGTTESAIKAFGGTWGLLPGLSKSFSDFKLRAATGVIGHLIYLEDKRIDRRDFLARPGLRLEASMSFPKISISEKPFRLNIGVLGDLFWPQHLLHARESNRMFGVFFVIESEFPYRAN